MKTLKQFLDWLSPQAPPPEVQEADRENMSFDRTQLDQSLGRLLATKDEFSEIIAQVVRDVKLERRHRRNEKTPSRSGKT